MGPKREDLMKNTIQKGSIGDKYRSESIGIAQDLIIPSARSSEVTFDPNFKVYLTFFVNTGYPPTETEYTRQIENPRNGDKKIVPISYSLDLTGILKRTIKNDPYIILKDGPANLKLIRAEVGNYTGRGIYNLYENFAKDISDRTRLDQIVKEEIGAVSNRGGQFELAVPQTQKDIIVLTNTSENKNAPKYPVTRFSNKGSKTIMVENGKMVRLPKEYFIEPTDKIVVGFGNFIGQAEENNIKRKLLMYLTPKELMPKL